MSDALTPLTDADLAPFYVYRFCVEAPGYSKGTFEIVSQFTSYRGMVGIMDLLAEKVPGDVPNDIARRRLRIPKATRTITPPFGDLYDVRCIKPMKLSD